MCSPTRTKTTSGGARELLPDARFPVSSADWRARHVGIFPLPRTRWRRGVLTRPELVRFTGQEVGPFGASRDVVGDGSVILLPTADHTPRSVSVLVYGGDWDVLCVGDLSGSRIWPRPVSSGFRLRVRTG